MPFKKVRSPSVQYSIVFLFADVLAVVSVVEFECAAFAASVASAASALK